MTPSLLDFVRAGGVPDWRMWLELDEPSRALLVEAREEVEADRAAVIVGVYLSALTESAGDAVIAADLTTAGDALAATMKGSSS